MIVFGLVASVRDRLTEPVGHINFMCTTFSGSIKPVDHDAKKFFEKNRGNPLIIGGKIRHSTFSNS